jgi:hypothetical protein
MNIVDIKKIQKLIGSEGGTAIVVDSLPTENIKPNVIYAVKKIDYYTSIYGTKMPTYTLENKDTWSKTAVEICSAKGLTKEEIQALGIAAGIFGFAVSNYLVHDDGIDYISKNIFDSGLFVWECASNQTGITHDQFSIERSFNTVVELYEYLLSENFVNDINDVDSEGGNLSLFASDVVDTLKSLNFKYQTTSLTADEIGVVFETTYDYYIYNGKEWVGVGSSVDTSRLTNTINIQTTDTVLSDSDYALYKQNPYGTTIVENGVDIDICYRCFEGSYNAFIATSFISDGYIKAIAIDSNSPHTITRQTTKLDVPSNVRDTVNHSISINITLDSNNNPSWTDSEKEKFLDAIEVGNLNRVGLSFPYYWDIADACATYNGSFSLGEGSMSYIFSTSVIPDVVLEGNDFIPKTLAITVLVNSDKTTKLVFWETDLRHEEREVITITDIDFSASPGQQGLISSDEASKITSALASKSLVEIQVGMKLYSFQSGRVIQGAGSVSVDNIVYFSNVEKTDTDVIVNNLKIDTQNLTYIITSSIIPKDEGFVDISSLIPSDGNIATSGATLATLLNTAYDKGYTKVYAEQESSKSSFYAVASKPTTESDKADWQGVIFNRYNDDTISYMRNCHFSYGYKASPDNSSVVYVPCQMAIPHFETVSSNQDGGWVNGFSTGLQTNINGSKTLTAYSFIDVYGSHFTLPTITSAKQTFNDSSLKSIYKFRKLLVITNGITVNGHTITTKNITLYGIAGLSNSSSNSYYSKFAGGSIVDENNNEYDLEIENTGTYSSQNLQLKCIQRSIKLADNSTSGTFTDYEISTLQNGTKQIELNNGIYKLSNTGADSITFTSLAGKKHINIVISTKAWTLVEETAQSTCYDTNETIDFTSIMAEYIADTTKSGKIRPFTSSDTLLSSAAIKAIIDGNYKMFSFNAKIGEQVMEAYMPISYHSDTNFYTFKGQVTFYNNVWGTIDVQMQFIHNPTTGSYINNPGYGFFKFTPETAISA